MLSCGYAYLVVLNVHMILQIRIFCSKCWFAIDITLLSMYFVTYILAELSSCPNGIIVANIQQIMTVRGDRMDYAQRLLFCSVQLPSVSLYSFCSIPAHYILFYSIVLCSALFCSSLFYYVLLFQSIRFCSIICRSLNSSTPFYFVLLYYVHFCFVLFCSLPF